MLRKKFTFIFVFLFIFQLLIAANLKRIIRIIEKQDYDKAIELLKEDIQEEPINPGAFFLYADLLAVDTLPYYDLDRARQYIEIAIDQYDSASTEIIEDLEKANIQRISLDKTYNTIRRLTFQRSEHKNTLQSYNEFLNLYPDSPQADIAIDRRDSIAYEQVKEIHTWEAYKGYMEKYPRSRYRPIAAVRYQRLLYLDRTSSGSLTDLENFVAEHPDNPFVERVISEIFRKRTRENTTENYREFVGDYPSSKVAKKALDFLYHLDPDRFFRLPELKLYRLKGRYNYRDSIALVHEKNKEPLFTYIERGKTGFMDVKGNTFIHPVFDEFYLQNAYCSTFKNDILPGSTGEKKVILNRISETVYEGDFTNVKDLGHGILWTNDKKVLHKSGFIIYEDIEDAEVLDGAVIRLKKNDKWALGSFTGTVLTSYRFDDISQMGNFWVFEKDGEIALYTRDRLFEQGIGLEFKYDELELVNNRIMVGFNNDRECLVNDQLDFLIPWDEHTVYPDSVVYYAKNRGGKYIIYNRDITQKLGNEDFRNIQVSSNWLAVESEFWRVLNLREQQVSLKQYDSVKLINDYALFVKFSDSLQVHFPYGNKLTLSYDQKIYDLSSGDRKIQYLIASDEERKSIYDEFGNKILEGAYEEISFLSDSLFRIEEEGYQGVISRSGNILLETEYQLVQLKNDMLVMLRDGRIGCVDLATGMQFDPEYESAFQKIGPFYAATKEGRTGLLDTLNEAIVPFEYQEIEPLNDSLFWVKTDTTWQVMKAGINLPLIKGVRSYRQVSVSDYTFFEILTSSGYGLVSEKGELLISPSFSDLQFMDFDDEAVIRAEKYFVEADYYILVWYNQYAKKIHTAAYREVEYEPFYCD